MKGVRSIAVTATGTTVLEAYSTNTISKALAIIAVVVPDDTKIVEATLTTVYRIRIQASRMHDI
jgi:hypothetical protein